MIASPHDTEHDIWTALAAPLPPDAIQWRQDGKAVPRDGGYVARFVAYIDAQFVRERLDSVVPGQWDLTLDLLPQLADEDGAPQTAFKARLQILGVLREDVGTGRDFKAASSDAFKRAAVRYGIGAELYAFGQNWVRVDGDGKFARPIEDPSAVYARKQRPAAVTAAAAAMNDADLVRPARTPAPAPSAAPLPSADPATDATMDPPCPTCAGKMWDNRVGKRNPKAPDFKCRDAKCEGVIWPPKPTSSTAPAVAKSVKQPITAGPMIPGIDDEGFPPPFADDDRDDLPFN